MMDRWGWPMVERAYIFNIAVDTTIGDVNVELQYLPTSIKINFTSVSGNGKVDLADFRYEMQSDHRFIGQTGAGDMPCM
jgi:hypothetical protein